MALAISNTTIYQVEGDSTRIVEDLLVTEEPLEIRIGYGYESQRKEISLAVTMRTPGQDRALVIGLLITEGIITNHQDLLSIKYCQSAKHPENIMRAELDYDISFDTERYKRNLLSSSSCGICGKAYIDSIKFVIKDNPKSKQEIKASIVYQLAKKLSANQSVFNHTGGLHAAALFDIQGNMITSNEDIGRHNALDKLIGTIDLKGIKLNDKFVLLSGRIGFELVQKCLMAKINTIIAIGAPSSLAVEMAVENEMCLIGFLKPHKFNIYSGQENIVRGK